ncbi:MAG: phage baseplate assembly protein V, partial [Tumebacillaceae bacterium]
MKTIGKSVKTEIVYTNLTTAADVQSFANVLLEERAREYLSGDGQCLGLPELVAGRYVKLEFVGDEFSDPVFIASVTHTIDSGSGYLTSFSVGGGKSAVEKLAGSGDKDVQEAAKTKGITQGVMVAIVTDNKDPDGLARVKLKFPKLEGDEESDWARISSLMAGNDRGSLFIPEVGDEVLVAFHMGDITQPYVLGTLWNTQQPSPKVDGDKNNISKFKSRAGHELIFDDDDSAGKVTIHTKKGHIIEFTDQDDTIKIADSNGTNTISVVGGSTNEISIKSSSSEIKINQQGAITINGTQSVKVTAPQISLEANATLDLKASGSLNISSDGLLNIKGSMVKIN